MHVTGNKGFARHPYACSMAGTIDSFSYMGKNVVLMQNILIVRAMQHIAAVESLYWLFL